jgi:hypothetical protein
MALRSAATVLLLAPVLGGACGGASGTETTSYGISVSAPEGWHAQVARGLLVAETEGARVRLFETSPENASPPAEPGTFPPLAGPLSFGPGDFRSQDRQAHATRAFEVSGRLFHAFVETNARPPDPQTLAELNELLASLEVAAGDFYSGFVDPPRFTARPGWHVGNSGPEEVDADGEYTTAWAATVPYTDEWNEFPPHGTLDRLPPDGILIRLTLSRSNRYGSPEEALAAPYRLDTFENLGFEGAHHALFRRFGRAGLDMQLELYVFFGRPEPTPVTRAQAETMLAGLELPDWGPWELEP